MKGSSGQSAPQRGLTGVSDKADMITGPSAGNAMSAAGERNLAAERRERVCCRNRSPGGGTFLPIDAMGRKVRLRPNAAVRGTD